MSALRILRARLAPAAGLSALLGAVLLLAACGGSKDGDGSSAAGDAPDLAGKTFVSTASTGRDLVEGTAVSLAFTDRLISANAGCNTMNGAATWTAGVLTVSGDALASTQMMCPEPLMRQDAWLTRFLTSGPAVTLTGTRLLLEKDDVSLALVEEQPLPLETTDWKLTGTIANQGVSTVPTGVEAGLTIPAGTTTMELQGGCNSGSAEFTPGATNTPTEGTLTIETGPTMTLMACGEDAMAVEQQVVAVLTGTVGYAIDGDTLTLTNDDLGLVYTGS